MRWIALLGWLAVTFLAALVGGQFMPGEWYAELAKPSWNPPNWIFGPVWTLLYILMAVAAWMVWEERERSQTQVRAALLLFVLHLVFNGAWSWIFFGLEEVGWALVDIGVVWLFVAALVGIFWKIRPWAGRLLVPYFVWVSFAVALNFAILQLN